MQTPLIVDNFTGGCGTRTEIEMALTRLTPSQQPTSVTLPNARRAGNCTTSKTDPFNPEVRK